KKCRRIVLNMRRRSWAGLIKNSAVIIAVMHTITRTIKTAVILCVISITAYAKIIAFWKSSIQLKKQKPAGLSCWPKVLVLIILPVFILQKQVRYIILFMTRDIYHLRVISMPWYVALNHANSGPLVLMQHKAHLFGLSSQ